MASLFFGFRVRQAVPHLLEVCRALSSDLLVREDVECGSAVVAEALGPPHAGVQASFLHNIRELRD